jgi:uncharacterized protein (TIGR03083 family)
MNDELERHRRARAGFGHVVDSVGDRWDAPSPCSGWDARAVLEHVIGFHEVLILRPLAIRAGRPRHDPIGRWHATDRALDDARSRLTPDMTTLLPALTTDVLVHTWDLARAAGADETLDPDLVTRALAQAETNRDALAASEMFGPRVEVSPAAPAPIRMLACYGRRA